VLVEDRQQDQAQAAQQEDATAAYLDRRVEDAAAGGVGFRVSGSASPAAKGGGDGGDAEQEGEDPEYKPTRSDAGH
jgi:hypothetical protein